MTRTTRWRRTLALAAAVPLVSALAACASADSKPQSGSSASTPAAASTTDSAAPLAESKTLRLGFFGNVTHATPLVGLKEGIYAKALGSTTISTKIFNAGPAAVEAITGGSLDAAYLGPNPAINGYVKSKGKLLRIIAGATSGGAALVVKPSITSVAQLKGAKLATPQLGGTQDVALRAFLNTHGLKVPVSGKGDVSIINAENATTLQQFQAGAIDGAWLPEPWASRLVIEAGAKVLVDEKTLWPAGKFVTTHLVVSQEFLDKYPGTVKKLLEGQVETTAWIKANPDKAKADVNAQLADPDISGKALEQDVLDAAWKNIAVTDDPIASSLKQSAQNAVSAGLLDPPDLSGIYDLRLLDQVLQEHGEPAVDAAGLGV
ncbi:NitT/TauT family transport system substrate-binding protein [Motilibacter peucedani]|uniref:NitT/TauT family transport system substrate-binding protein n=1 Tax=Motilibacter peucedani TaxID=598650 RepID=A0A420XS97_9ACTN|nr:ABC transporter substrate-binding protein [Motilibacter peucedani]RKS77700.1 NitT/TauT family transport system substrate-binding protein [Motilibacter peucedani]